MYSYVGFYALNLLRYGASLTGTGVVSYYSIAGTGEGDYLTK